MEDRVIYIKLGDWEVIYFKGKKFAEGHYISTDKLIRLGMLMQETGIDIADMIKFYIGEDEVSDETLLWEWDNNVNNLPDEVKNIIMKNIKSN